MSSTLSKAQIAKVVEILHTARMDKSVKLRFGYRKRSVMEAALKAGQAIDPTDYRYVWIKETRDAIIELLAEQGKKFNAANTHDCVSLQDFLDCLNSSLLLIKAKIDA